MTVLMLIDLKENTMSMLLANSHANLDLFKVKSTTPDFMYIGPLEYYQYKNSDINDLLYFLKSFSNKSVFLIDNLMCEFDFKQIPDKYDIIIIGIFGELANRSLLESMFEYFRHKQIIVIASHYFTVNLESNVKIFNLEHLHKSLPYILQHIPNTHTSGNTYILDYFKNISQRKYTASCLVRRVDLSRLNILALFIKNYDLKSIVFSYLNINDYKVEAVKNPISTEGKHTLYTVAGLLPIEKKILFQILNGPKINSEVFSNLSDEAVDQLEQYYHGQSNLESFNASLNNLIDFKQTFDITICPYAEVKLNYALETSVITPSYWSAFLTEKTLKPIMSKTPFVIISNQDSYKRLSTLGFETFIDEFDIDYLDEIDNEDFVNKLYAVDTVMKKLTNEFVLEHERILQEKVNFNFNWFNHHFVDHCDNLNKHTIEEIQDYIANL